MLLPKTQESSVQEAVVTSIFYRRKLHNSVHISRSLGSCSCSCTAQTTAQPKRGSENTKFMVQKEFNVLRGIQGFCKAQIALFYLKEHLLFCVSNSPHPGRQGLLLSPQLTQKPFCWEKISRSSSNCPPWMPPQQWQLWVQGMPWVLYKWIFLSESTNTGRTTLFHFWQIPL